MTTVTLKVEVSDLNNVFGYAFSFLGKPVGMTNGEGEIEWDDSHPEWLQWHMVGDPGGWMKVEVFKGKKVISKREQSKLPNSRGLGFDEIPIPQQLDDDAAAEKA